MLLAAAGHRSMHNDLARAADPTFTSSVSITFLHFVFGGYQDFVNSQLIMVPTKAPCHPSSIHPTGLVVICASSPEEKDCKGKVVPLWKPSGWFNMSHIKGLRRLNKVASSYHMHACMIIIICLESSLSKWLPRICKKLSFESDASSGTSSILQKRCCLHPSTHLERVTSLEQEAVKTIELEAVEVTLTFLYSCEISCSSFLSIFATPGMSTENEGSERTTQRLHEECWRAPS